MTRLVNEQRTRIKNAILADVPTVDYHEQIRVRALKLAVFELPAAAKRLWENVETRGLLKTNSFYPHDGDGEYEYGLSVSVPGFDEQHAGFLLDEELRTLVTAYKEQKALRMRLGGELRNNLASVTTHEQFAERWPELVKYLPDGSEAKVANLTATTALIDGLRAAGLELDTETKAA